MKKITLALVAAVGFWGSVHSQANFLIQAPVNNGSTSEFRAPNGTNLHAFQRTVMYISAAEMLPMSLSSITSFSFQYVHGTGTTPVPGTLTVYMVNTNDNDYLKSTTWATAITGMNTCYNGTYTVPAASGSVAVGVNFSAAFNYTGGAVYIAYDWVSTGPFSAATATYASNNTKVQCATGDASVTPAPTALGFSAFRPALLFKATNTATNDIGVLDVLADGKISKQFNAPQTIVADVANSSIGAQSNVTVALTVGGANVFTDTKIIASMPAGSISSLTFAPFTSSNSGINTISVTALFPDQNLANNQRVWTQSVTCTEVGTVPPVLGSAFITSNAYGNGTGTGFIYTTLYTPVGNCVLTGVRMVVANLPAYNIGKPITPVLLDNTGTILASGSPVVTTSGMLGNWTNFAFQTPPALTAGTDYFIGASVSSPTFYPISILNNTYTPYFFSPGFFTSPAAGGTLAQLDIDYFGIEASIGIGNVAISIAATKTTVCKSDGPGTVTLTASGVSTYTWSTGATGSSIVVTPSVSGTGGGVISYTASGTNSITGCKATAAVKTISVSTCTGLVDNTFGAGIKLFPNPSVNGMTKITGLEGTNVVTVFNAIGQVVLTQNVSQEILSLDL